MISEDAEEYSKAITLMVDAVAPKLKQKGCLVHQICELSLSEGMTTRRVEENKIESALLAKIFEYSKCRIFLTNKCHAVAMTVSFRQA